MDIRTDEPRSFFVDANGIRLHALDWGGTGAPIIILHATGFIGRLYRPIALALREAGHVYSYDQRGHGDSSRPADGDYSWERTVDDLRAFIAALGLEGARGLGHSAGATAVGALAGERPDLVSRAVLVEPVVFDEVPIEGESERQNELYTRTIKRKRWFESVDAMFRNFGNKPPYDTWRRDMLREYCEHATWPAPNGGVELKCPPEVEAEYYARSRQYVGLPLILSSRAPLLVMFGANSDSVGNAISEKISTQLRHGRVVTIAGTGHFLPMERPEEVARMAREFFAEA
ncbi:MAG TPA: alpha/beta hydrolase [Candidatus Binataceae bacterium]|jgi:pimeloyl-ACP methyl ester carboxylesterase|nr:alpha/beta hydrolase [Candidatus Binataceae bacterium]